MTETGPEPIPAAPAAADPTPPPTTATPPADAAAAPATSPPASSEPGMQGPRRRRRRRRGRGRHGLEGPPLVPGQAPPARAELSRPDQPRPDHPRPDHSRPDRPRYERRGHDRSGHEHLAFTAIRSLAQMAQGLLAVEGIDALSQPRWLEIAVRVPLDPKRDGSKAASKVVEQILQRVQQVREHDRALVPGAVYCYFTESAEVAHARPQEPREVFDGYQSTGRPIFTDFVTMAIERKDPGLDQLLAGEDVVLTHVTMGRVLRTAQLHEFGKGSQVYRILGQVDAGLFPVLNSDRKAAFSFQLLRGQTLEGNARLKLHWVSAVDLMDLADPAVPLVLSRFQKRLDAESLRLAGKQAHGPVQEEEFVLPLLQDLARQLSGMQRRKSRRTQHAAERTEEGQRPTARAFPDALEARDEDLLWDDVEGTIVVLGRGGRVHVFARDGKHVTSVMMNGSAIGRRRQQGRWRPAEPEERGEFRLRLKRALPAPDTVAPGHGQEQQAVRPAPATAPGGPVSGPPDAVATGPGPATSP